MRVKRGTAGHRRHKRRLKLAEGYRGRRSDCFKLAKRAVEKALQFSYRDRRAKKRDFRGLWIIRINAAARLNGLSYSKLIKGLSDESKRCNGDTLSIFTGWLSGHPLRRINTNPPATG